MSTITVAEVMTTPVMTVAEDWTLSALATFFIENNVSGAPVTSLSGEVVGVVSMTDIVRHSTEAAVPGAVQDTHEYYLATSGRQYSYEELQGFHIESGSDVTARDLMTPMLFQVAEDATVQDVADMMVRGGIHRVLVTRDRKVVGIATALDMLKVVRDM